VRLRSGIKAWGKYLTGHLEVGGRAARGGQRRRKKAVGVGRRIGEDTADTQGPLDRETRERRPARESVNQKGKRISREDATDARAGWAGRALSACGRRRGQWAGWAKRPGGPQGRPGRNQEKDFLN
jgi:hypothetical protein